MYIIDSIKQYDGSTKVLAINDNQLEVRTYPKGSIIPKSDETHPKADYLKVTKRGDTLKVGDFCEGTVVDNYGIIFSKGDFELQKLVCDFTGYKNLRSKDFVNG